MLGRGDVTDEYFSIFDLFLSRPLIKDYCLARFPARVIELPLYIAVAIPYSICQDIARSFRYHMPGMIHSRSIF